MKRILILLIIGLIPVLPARAEDAPAAAPAADTTTTAPVAPAPEIAVPVVDTTAPAAASVAETAPVAADAVNAENLEFVSGEVSTLDEASKTLTVKLYGESDSTPSDKTLKVTVDPNTDITDGEQDRDLKSLTAGTEVDVEYDPATNKATYIFVY